MESRRDRDGSAHRSSRRRPARGGWAWIEAQLYIEDMKTEDRLVAEGWGIASSTAKLRWGSPESNIPVRMRPERRLTTDCSKQFDVDDSAEEDQP